MRGVVGNGKLDGGACERSRHLEAGRIRAIRIERYPSSPSAS